MKKEGEPAPATKPAEATPAPKEATKAGETIEAKPVMSEKATDEKKPVPEGEMKKAEAKGEDAEQVTITPSVRPSCPPPRKRAPSTSPKSTSRSPSRPRANCNGSSPSSAPNTCSMARPAPSRKPRAAWPRSATPSSRIWARTATSSKPLGRRSTATRSWKVRIPWPSSSWKNPPSSVPSDVVPACMSA